MGKNIGKYISKSLNRKNRQKIIYHAKHYAAVAFKTSSKRVTQKTAKRTGDLIDNKIANKITKVLKNSQQINLETVTVEYDK